MLAIKMEQILVVNRCIAAVFTYNNVISQC